MSGDPLQQERHHLANLLEAIQRCAYFLHESERKLDWPLEATYLSRHKKDVELFGTLAAINERFAKLQDTLAATMRHGVIIMGEASESFLKILGFYEKVGVIESIQEWQRSRVAWNLAAHDYETDYAEIADHFNSLKSLSNMLFETACRLINLMADQLNVLPATGDFEKEFSTLFSPSDGVPGP